MYFKIRDSGIIVVETLCMYYYFKNNLIETYPMPFSGFKGVCDKYYKIKRTNIISRLILIVYYGLKPISSHI